MAGPDIPPGPSLVAQCRERGVTAFIAASSLMSINVIQAIEASGRRVPDDAAVVGIGGRALAEGGNHRLARVDLGLDACSRAALDYIAGRISGETPAAGLLQPPRLESAPSLAPPRPA
ncbi:substrate-binding domain-containing protein [Starkeya koreensis]|uniref:Substrate-binding domain-containing protein n=1 Tax=Ancylobacter koreensis TaxID=266121 RepID=A0ABT0DKJ8_9HYPH|nr:substrate-binding domain-containing protein [Ancylobacter koreensis]MCK0207807.1 substrate-binding domain-containing protein [Ancylobacter koreensis]